MKKLKDIAEKIAVNFMRIGFDPMTEQTKFVAIINFQSFDFHCGLLACIPATKKLETYRGSGSYKVSKPLENLLFRYKQLSYCHNYDRIYTRIRSGQISAAKNVNCPDVMKVFHDISMLCEPTAWDLLYCLQIDCQAANQSFDDWCSEFGYDTDSIKALNTYNTCIESAKKLKVALGPALYKEVMESEPE